MTDIALSRWFFDRLAAPKRMVVLDGARHLPTEQRLARRIRRNASAALRCACVVLRLPVRPTMRSLLRPRADLQARSSARAGRGVG